MGSEMFDELTIDLRRPPSSRWHLTLAARERGRELLTAYRADLRLRPDAGEFLLSAARALSAVTIGRKWNRWLVSLLSFSEIRQSANRTVKRKTTSGSRTFSRAQLSGR